MYSNWSINKSFCSLITAELMQVIHNVVPAVDGKAVPAILIVTPLECCTTKSSIKGPVVLGTTFSLISSPLSTKEEISDPGSELAAAEAGLNVIHASI